MTLNYIGTRTFQQGRYWADHGGHSNHSLWNGVVDFSWDLHFAATSRSNVFQHHSSIQCGQQPSVSFASTRPQITPM